MIDKIKSQEDDVIDKLNFRKRQEESKELEGSTEATSEQEESKFSFNPEDFLDDFRQDTGKRYIFLKSLEEKLIKEMIVNYVTN